MENENLTKFLTESPPSTKTNIQIEDAILRATNWFQIVIPDIKLYCNNESCLGERYFKCNNRFEFYIDRWTNSHLEFKCKNCSENIKVYSIAVNAYDETQINIIKIGEWPAFGPHTPAKLISLIGPDRDEFLKGRKSESQNLGIGAFTYYRRVVENQKNRIIDEMIKALQNNNSAKEVIQKFEVAKSETQFSKAIDAVKEAFPEMLLINGHNPLTILHSALSEGIHNHNDEECLEYAKSIRIVLSELAERLSQLSKNHSELQKAITNLFKKK
ncbi:MAG: hypothetical protein IIC75_04395 [Bacteroidetes bacterium]|nr:hypothetical protein [Bacteroidota bacterium]